jgi:hypothetical protein
MGKMTYEYGFSNRDFTVVPISWEESILYFYWIFHDTTPGVSFSADDYRFDAANVEKYYNDY